MGADPNMKATTGELSPLYCCINQLATARLSPEELKEKMNIFPSTLEEQDVFHRYGDDLFGNLVNNQNFLLIQNGFTELLQNRMAEAYVLEKIYRIAELLLNHGDDPNQKHNNGDLKGYIPLMLCIEKGEVELSQLMLDHGGDIKQTYNYRGGDIGLIDIAQHWKSSKVLQLLKSKEVEI